MAGMTSRRGRAALLAATAVLAALTLTACGKSGGTTPAATTDPAAGNGRIGDVPSESASPTSGSGNGGGIGGGGTQAPTFPSDAKGYGLEILKAWAGKNNTRLATLVDSNSVNQIATYGFPNSQWTYYTCIPDPTYNRCSYTNGSADVVTMSITNALLGKPKAGSTITYTHNGIPTNTSDYVAQFISAWQMNNDYAQMSALSTPSVVSYFSQTSHFPVGTTVMKPAPCTNNKSKTCVEVQATPLGSAPSIYVIVDLSKTDHAKPNGIIGYQSTP